jgi:hypothetical protein
MAEKILIVLLQCNLIVSIMFKYTVVKGRNMLESTDDLCYTYCVRQVLALQIEVYRIAWNKVI